jgi:hypothetical protein
MISLRLLAFLIVVIDLDTENQYWGEIVDQLFKGVGELSPMEYDGRVRSY